MLHWKKLEIGTDQLLEVDWLVWGGNNEALYYLMMDEQKSILSILA